MINNCGILRGEATQSAEELTTLCREVYRTYRSPLAVDHPQSERCRKLKNDVSSVWQARQPIRFMGIIDAVGALGIPRLNAGIGLDYPDFEFYDQKVSSAVQVVYHALSLHERAWMLQPCFIYAPPGNSTIVKQQWFPGVHHDLGRSTFRYLRQRPWTTLEGLLSLFPSFLTKTAWPNEVCSDVAARWLLQGIKDVSAPTDPNLTFPGIDFEIRRLGLRISAPDPRTLGTGDPSAQEEAATPASSTPSFLDLLKRVASLPFTLLNSLFPRFGNVSDSLGLTAILSTLAASTDRRIPRATQLEEVYPYLSEETVVDDAGRERRFTVGKTAALERERGGFVSRSFETLMARWRVFGW